jgi:hypothetical protein
MTCILHSNHICCYDSSHIKEHVLRFVGADYKRCFQSMMKTEIDFVESGQTLYY